VVRTLIVVWLGMTSVLAGCARPETAAPAPPHSSPPPGGPGWRAVTDVPLSPRQNAIGLWTGSEVLLIGGSDAPVCPPMADCVADPTPLADGAAYDPATGAWRPLAAAPTPLLNASAVMVGQTAYFLHPSWSDRDHRLLAYDTAAGRWRTYPAPGDPATSYELVAAGNRLVALHGTDESSESSQPGPDLVLDPAAGTWGELPDDPMGPAFNRNAEWFNGELLVFENKLVANPGATPTLVRSAALNLEAGTWRRLPDAPMLNTGPWHPVGPRLVNPTLGGTDGGEINNYGRSYPFGGVIDPVSGRFAPLPKPPRAKPYNESAGVLTTDSALYVNHEGLLLDATTEAWITIPSLPDGQAAGRTTVAAGTDMFVFGGGVWPGPDGKGELINRAWLWSPRRDTGG
jgi:hypothetical protein